MERERQVARSGARFSVDFRGGRRNRDSDSNDRRSTGSSISSPSHSPDPIEGRIAARSPPPPPLPAIFIYRLARNDRSFPHGGNFVYTKEYRGLDGRTRFQNRFSSAVASMQRDGDVDDDVDTTTRFFLFSLSFSRRYFSIREAFLDERGF